jgi:hypothetical protein
MSCSSSSPGKWRKGYVPQSACRVMNGSTEATGCGSCCLRSRKIRRKGWKCLRVVARIIGKLYGHGLRGTLWNGTVQLLDCTLGLHPLVEPDEPNSFRKSCVESQESITSILWLYKTWSWMMLVRNDDTGVCMYVC